MNDFVVHSEAALRAALVGFFLPDPMARAREGRVLRATLHRTTSRVLLPDGRAVLLKVHRSKGLREGLLSLVRSGRARKEWVAGGFLVDHGLPVARPLALGERRRRGMLESSFFVAEFLEGAEAWAERPGSRDDLAALVRRMHDAGFDHRDLHSGNILVGPDGLHVVDLHRHRVGRVGDLARVRALAKWLHSDPAADRPAFLRAYGADPAWLARVEREIVSLERTRVRSRSKRPFVEGTVFTRDVGRGAGSRRRDLSVERLDRAIREHDEALAAGDARTAKRNERGAVTCHGDLVVKEHAPESGFDRLRAQLWPRRLAAGYRNAHRLGVLGFAAARPLAFVRRDGRTFSVFEDLSALPRLDLLAREVYRGGLRARQDVLRTASASWVASLHGAGVYHGDLKGVNVRVRQDAEHPEFLLIDTDRCRFSTSRVERRRRVKNLAQLAASIPRSVTRTERLRWWREYAKALGTEDEERTVAREVTAALAEKILVVDDPIE